MNAVVNVVNKLYQFLYEVRFCIQYALNTLLDGIMHKCVKPQNIPKLSRVCSHATKIFLCTGRKLFQCHVAPISPWRQTNAPKIMEFELTLYQ
jgi:hypothetical protein